MYTGKVLEKQHSIMMLLEYIVGIWQGRVWLWARKKIKSLILITLLSIALLTYTNNNGHHPGTNETNMDRLKIVHLKCLNWL